jgi:HEAT repeat protein
VRIRAIRSLGRMKAREAVAPVIEALSHEVSNVRKESAIALGEIGDPKAIPALEKARLDADPDVRKLAQLALASIVK